MLYEPGYFADQSMNEYCCKTMLDFIHEHSEDKIINVIDVPDWVKTNFMVSTSEMFKHNLPRGEWCFRLSSAIEALVSYTDLIEQPDFARGAVWGSLKMYDMTKREEQ